MRAGACQGLGRRVALRLDDEAAAHDIVRLGAGAIGGQGLPGLQAQVAAAFIGQLLPAEQQPRCSRSAAQAL